MTMKKKEYLLQLFIVHVSCVLLAVATDITDRCKQPPDVGACSTIFLAWYYDWEQEECREFIYGGCGGNNNRFESEEKCYEVCREQLIDLHPPERVSVPITFVDKIYLYWLPPENFKIHDPTNETHTIAVDLSGNPILTPKGPGVSGKGPGVTHALLNLGTTVAPGSKSSKSQQSSSTKSSQSGVTNSSQNTGGKMNNRTDVEMTNQNTTELTDNENSGNSTDTKESTIESNKDGNANVTGDVKDTNSSAKNNTSDGNSGNSVSTTVNSSVIKSTEKPEVTNSTANDSSGSSSERKAIKYQLEDFYWKERVPYHFAILTGYVVSYKRDADFDWKNMSLNQNTTEIQIRNLTAGTPYSIRVGAVYKTHTVMFSAEIKAETLGSSMLPRACRCHPLGTVGGAKNCSLSPPNQQWCRCKPGYSGLFCEFCHSGYYRLHMNFECHRCPCSPMVSSGHCYFFEGYLHCQNCREGYVGRMCQHCDNGYYRDHRTTGSVCVKCEGCHNVGQGLICEPSTGNCINCHYNTTGHKCDRCLPGFEGDPLKNISCKWIETHKAAAHMLSSGIIALIVIIVILVLSAIVGCVIYRRMKNYPLHRPFWTIELNEGREGVNFSSVPDDDLDQYHDDVKFMEKESKGKAQPYLRLQEDI